MVTTITLGDITTFAQLSAPFLTIVVLFLTLRLTRRMKMADVLIECNRRYDSLCIERLGAQCNSEAYYERFWNLQFEQFRHRKNGLVDDDTFKYWMERRHIDYVKNKKIAGVYFKDGWASARQGNEYRSDFTSIIDLACSGEIESAVNNSRPRLLSRIP